MCRFIVYHGPAANMASLVMDPEHSMLQLASNAFCRYTPINIDGFGLSWYERNSAIPLVYKDIIPAYESTCLNDQAKSVTSTCFFAHVRAGSVGAVELVNCHPFKYKNISFMHNGTVPYFIRIKAALMARVSTRARKLIQGSTDSEAMFALFITNFELEMGLEVNEDQKGSLNCSNKPYEYINTQQDHTDSMIQAMKTTLRQVHFLILQHEYDKSIQKSPEEEISEFSMDGATQYPKLPYTYGTGRLNLAVSDGQTTCTTRYVTSQPWTAHTLYYSAGNHFDSKSCRVIGHKEDSTEKATVIVVSEPLDAKFNCDPVPVNHMVVSGPKFYFSIVPCDED